MRVVDVRDAQTQFDELLTRVELVDATGPRSFGGMILTIPDDFDAPMNVARAGCLGIRCRDPVREIAPFDKLRAH